jgi:hypothetical protein
MIRRAAVVLAMAPALARADAPRDKPAAIEIDRDREPAGRVGFGFDGGEPVATWGVSLATSWIDRPIRLDGGDPVRHRQTLALGAAIAVGDSAVLDATVRGSHQVGDRLQFAGDPRALRRAVFQDLRFGARFRVAGDADRAAFMYTDLTVPSGNDLHFAGDERTTVVLGLIGRATLPHGVVIAGTVGVRLHGAEVAVGDRVISDELLAAGGVEVPIGDGPLALTGEVLAALGDAAPPLAGQRPIEPRIGAIVRPAPGWAIGAHVGAGVDDAIGAPRWRAIVTLAWTPPAAPHAATPAPIDDPDEP